VGVSPAASLQQQETRCVTIEQECSRYRAGM
jgi:hypothetical protein